MSDGGGVAAATETLAEAVPPVPPSTEVTAPVVLFLVPAVVPVTPTLKVHPAPAASVAPVKRMPPDAAVATIMPPPQLPMRPLGVATKRPRRQGVREANASQRRGDVGIVNCEAERGRLVQRNTCATKSFGDRRRGRKLPPESGREGHTRRRQNRKRKPNPAGLAAHRNTDFPECRNPPPVLGRPRSLRWTSGLLQNGSRLPSRPARTEPGRETLGERGKMAVRSMSVSFASSIRCH